MSVNVIDHSLTPKISFLIQIIHYKDITYTYNFIIHPRKYLIISLIVIFFECFT